MFSLIASASEVEGLRDAILAVTVAAAIAVGSELEGLERAGIWSLYILDGSLNLNVQILVSGSSSSISESGPVSHWIYSSSKENAIAAFDMGI